MTDNLIAFEGIDGSGKGLQSRRLQETLSREGLRVARLEFPQYRDTFFGQRIGDFLNGHFGAFRDVPPFLAAMLFAGDRFESRPKLCAALAQHDVVICDRYVPSNIAHQASRASHAHQAEVAAWIEHLEYTTYQLPRPNLVIWLDMPPEHAATLIPQKDARSYTQAIADEQEADRPYQAQVAQAYGTLAAANPSTWIRIPGADGNAIRSADAIAADVYQQVQQRQQL